MATVALGEDTVLGRPVALKRLHTTEDVRGLSRLKREALLGASVSHPNLVAIYDVVTTEEHDLVIVMEYVAGETLRQALNRDHRLPVAEALRVLQGAAAGLDAIHRHGIVHRDVKPSNILLGTDGAVKVADLGIASVPEQTRITTAGSMVGSLSYMAPEQLEDGQSTPAIDVYALSAVAFEMLSGRKARREANPVALAHAISTLPPSDLREAWPDAPFAAADLLIGGMARDAAARPPSAGELVARLAAALEPEDTAPVAPPTVTAETWVNLGARDVPPASGARASATPRIAAARGVAPTARANRVDAGGRSSRPLTRLAAAWLLALVAAAVGLAVVLSTGGSRPQKRAQVSQPTARQRSAAGSRSSSAKRAVVSRTTSASTTPAARASGSATTSGSAAAASASGSATTNRSVPPASGATGAKAVKGATGATSPSSSSPTSTPDAGAPTPASVTPTTSDPVSAVQTFYELSASHQYSQAWALADPTMQNQLGGYPSFQSGQAGDRSITFTSARTLNQSGSAATVAITTTSVRNDGTHHCGGTVDLTGGGSPGRWLLHMIHINCT